MRFPGRQRISRLRGAFGGTLAAISYYAIDHDLTLKQAALANGVSEELFDKVVIPPQPHPPRLRRHPVRPGKVLTCKP